MDLRQDLQGLIAIHGVGKVYSELYSKMKEDYEFLREFFSAEPVPEKVTKVVKKKVVAAPSDAETTDMSASSLKDAKIRVVKKEDPRDPLELFPVETAEEPATAAPAASAPVKPPTFANPKEAKAWQKEQELKKKEELDAAGIVPNSLLTKENLEKWIIQDSRTYAYIAREYVGLPEAMISESAKAFGIQSEVSKKRNEMIKKKKVQMRSS